MIDSPEINAFAAPGGYVLVTRGLYQLVDANDDGELAAVLAHELSHVVQRDHYEVIRKQEEFRRPTARTSRSAGSTSAAAWPAAWPGTTSPRTARR